jgi:hypothetical protein
MTKIQAQKLAPAVPAHTQHTFAQAELCFACEGLLEMI